MNIHFLQTCIDGLSIYKRVKGTKCFTVCFTVKNVPLLERPYKCIHKHIPPMHAPPRVCTQLFLQCYTRYSHRDVNQFNESQRVIQRIFIYLSLLADTFYKKKRTNFSMLPFFNIYYLSYLATQEQQFLTLLILFSHICFIL